MTTPGQLDTGDDAPDFTLPDADGNQISLRSLRGKRVILYFYPAAMTPGCTTEACDFRDNLGSLSGAGYTVLGISPDPPEKLREFRDQQHLTYPLLADADHAVCEAYGAWGDKTVNGTPTRGVLRSTFVLDEQGRVQTAMYSVQATGHVAALRERLGVA